MIGVALLCLMASVLAACLGFTNVPYVQKLGQVFFTIFFCLFVVSMMGAVFAP
jgi:uncharacterized membrane protein YtjA (UPF0391 family)